jgi:6-phosphogluconolactonase (cycloisomerase 2 family)
MALAARRIALPLVASLLTALTGCAGFFVYPGSSSSTSSSGDYAYVANSASGSNYINGYSLSGGSLVATTGSPYSLGFIPSAMVVTTNNSYLYVASSGSAGEIYGYSIGTGGALTILNNSVGLEAENSVALDVSADGQWLFSLNADGLTLEEYKISTSTGLLTAEGNYPITGIAGGVVTPTSLRVAPSGNYIAATLGTGGADIFAFVTSTGIASSSAAVLPPLSTANGFYSVDIDSSNNLYLSGTSGLVVYTVVAGSGSVTATRASSSSGYTLGTGNVSTTINTANSYVFAGSENSSTSTGTIYSYAIGSGGALTAASGSPYNGPTDVAALGRDSTGNYLLAVGYSTTSGIQLFTIGSGGALTSTGSAASGNTLGIPAVLALTH